MARGDGKLTKYHGRIGMQPLVSNIHILTAHFEVDLERNIVQVLMKVVTGDQEQLGDTCYCHSLDHRPVEVSDGRQSLNPLRSGLSIRYRRSSPK